MACTPTRILLSNTASTTMNVTLSSDPGDGTTVTFQVDGLSISESETTSSGVAVFTIAANTAEDFSLWDATLQVASNTAVEAEVQSVETNGAQTIGVTLSDSAVTYCSPLAGGGGSGTVTSVTGTTPISVATGTTTPVVSLDDDGVTAAKIADDAVTTAKVADGAVTNGKIADLTIQHGKIADGAITTAKIAADGVTTAKIAAGAATDPKVTIREDLGATFDGQGSAVETAKSVLVPIERAGTISAASIVGDASGSITITVNRYTPSAGSIGSPTSLGTVALSSVQVARDTTLSGWTTSLSEGDILEFLTGGTIATVTRVTAKVKVER